MLQIFFLCDVRMWQILSWAAQTKIGLLLTYGDQGQWTAPCCHLLLGQSLLQSSRCLTLPEKQGDGLLLGCIKVQNWKKGILVSDLITDGVKHRRASITVPTSSFAPCYFLSHLVIGLGPKKIILLSNSATSAFWEPKLECVSLSKTLHTLT